MAITDIAGVLAGIENPLTFMTQVAGTMDAAGTPHSFFNLMRRPNVSAAFTKSWSISYVYDGNPYNYMYNPSVVCPLSVNDNVSVVTQYDVRVCGNYTVTSLSGDYTAYIDLAYRGTGTANYGMASRLISSNAPSFTGEVLTTSANQITFVNALSGYKYLAALTVTTGVPGVLLLCDRLWHNGGVPLMNYYTAVTSTLTSPSQIPARDINGSNNGVGVLAGLEILSLKDDAGTAGNVTLGYTNQAGTAGRSATTIITPTVRPRVGTFYPFGLQAGDTGIQKVTSITIPASWCGGFDPTLVGEAAIVLYRVLAAIDIPLAGVREKMDAVVSGFPRLFDNTVPFLIFIPQTTTSSYLNGSITYTSG